MSEDHNDDSDHASANESFAEIVAARISRREFLRSGLAATAALSLDGNSFLSAFPSRNADTIAWLQGVPVSSVDDVVIAEWLFDESAHRLG